MITLPRRLLVTVTATFSLYHVVLGVVALIVPEPGDTAKQAGVALEHPERVVLALVLFVVATALSLGIGRRVEIPAWLAGLNVGLSLSIALLGSSTIPPSALGDYSWFGTWYVAAIGTLLTITAVRRHIAYAWFGLGLVTAQTVLWTHDITAITRFGLLGDVVWVAIAAVFTRALARAALDVRQFARAEREAVEWQAAQDAHHFERQVRLTQTSRTALPMLRHIAAVEGELDEAARRECRVLEQSIRDEIRGRHLLNDAVRREVMAARRRGAVVQVLDDGGLDDVDPALLEPVLDAAAAAIAGVSSDRLILRTAPKGSGKAVTVVGISVDATAAALGLEDDDERVDLWLELDRPVAAAIPVATA